MQIRRLSGILNLIINRQFWTDIEGVLAELLPLLWEEVHPDHLHDYSQPSVPLSQISPHQPPQRVDPASKPDKRVWNEFNVPDCTRMRHCRTIWIIVWSCRESPSCFIYLGLWQYRRYGHSKPSFFLYAFSMPTSFQEFLLME